ncbi:restriction endonuclease subunit S [Rhizobium sp. NRK18]|uniref:restriction endonuclease subunit S n=1 Tax=Rhizobium sp. NRK18 TaxID=2964667 RepID=UPI0021C37599|nr:restriction endonuclease subunit S [Rhizobium sp. NRK18]MCQ2005256.1 restriction endonuclease subunit S [Rhizobium sp. NRK18]
MSREMPEGWRRSELGDLVKLEYGKALAGAERREGAVPVFGSSGIVGYHDKAVAAGPSIVISRKGSLGGVFYVEGGFWPIDTTYFVVQRENSDWQWLTYLLKFASLERLNEATGVPGLNRDKAAKEQVFVPPLHEQRRIAEILFSVDEAIAATRAVIEQTRKVKQGVLERLLTKGIGHTRFKQTEIGEIPEGWEVATLGDASVTIVDGDRGKEYPKAEDYQDDGYCLFLSAKNVTRSGFVFEECQFISEEKHRKLRNGLLQRSDIVVTTRGTIGNFAFYGPNIAFDCVRINSGMAVMRSTGSDILPEFLFALTASQLVDDQLKRRVFGSAQPQLTLDILRKLVVPVPPQEEQVSIAAQAKDLHETEKNQRAELTVLEQLKSTLMSDLLTGRKRVTDALPMAAE